MRCFRGYAESGYSQNAVGNETISKLARRVLDESERRTSWVGRCQVVAKFWRLLVGSSMEMSEGQVEGKVL